MSEPLTEADLLATEAFIKKRRPGPIGPGMIIAMMRHAGAPDPVAEYRFMADRRFRFDYAWPRYLIALEVDGAQWLRQGGRHNRDSDRMKLNYAASLGWRVFRASHDMLRDDLLAVFELIASMIKEIDALEGV